MKEKYSIEDLDLLIDELGFSNDCDNIRKLISSILTGDIKNTSLFIDDDPIFSFINSKNIRRFHKFPIMFNEDYNGIHQLRVFELIRMGESIIKLYFKNFNGGYAKDLALMHDFQEGVNPFGDIATDKKMGLSEKSKKILNYIDLKIAEIIGNYCFSEFYNGIYFFGDNEYTAKLFIDSVKKESIEAMLMSYFDKLDGLMVSLHEVIGGNQDFISPLKNYIDIFKKIKKGEILNGLSNLFNNNLVELKKYVTDYYKGDHNGVTEHFNSVEELFNIDSIIGIETMLDDLTKESKTHTKENIQNNYGIPAYGVWKKAVLDMIYIKENGVGINSEELLLNQSEV